MSLCKPTLASVVKKQFRYKVKAYIDSFISLIFIQLLALFFSFNGTGMMGTGNGTIHISIRYFNADIVIAFTLVWAFITAIIVTTKAYRNDDYLFVANGLSSHLANVLFLLAASLYAGVTAMTSSSLLKVLILLFSSNEIYSSSVNDLASIGELLIGIVATTLYVFLFCAIGYFIGMLVQTFRLFIIIIPVLIFGDIFFHARMDEMSVTISFFEQIFTEPSFFLFLIKVLVVTVGLFFLSFPISNRLEVR